MQTENGLELMWSFRHAALLFVHTLLKTTICLKSVWRVLVHVQWMMSCPMYSLLTGNSCTVAWSEHGRHPGIRLFMPSHEMHSAKHTCTLHFQPFYHVRDMIWCQSNQTTCSLVIAKEARETLWNCEPVSIHISYYSPT